MALRYHHTSRRTESKMLGIVIRVSAILAFVLGLIVILALVLVNGERIKDPAAEYLGKITGTEVTIGEAEYSPLYPDTIKLTNVTFKGQAHSYALQEAYIEISLTEAIFNDLLFFEDLYLRGITFPPDFLQSAAAKLPYPKLFFKTLRLDDFALETTDLKARSGALRLNEASYDEQGLRFEQGSLSISEASYQDLPLKNLSAVFKLQNDHYLLEELSGALLGGTFSGSGSFDQQERSFAFSMLNLSKLILKEKNLSALPFTVSSQSGTLSEVLLTDAKEELLASGVSGTYQKLQLSKTGLSADFKGQIAELSAPNLELTLEDSSAEISIREENLIADLKGRFRDGTLAVRLHADPPAKTITVENLELSQNKLELKSQLIDCASKLTQDFALSLEDLKLSEVSLLSYLDNLPISAEKLNLTASALLFDQHGVHGADTGVLNLNAFNFLYSDLLLSEISLMGTLSDKLITLSSPKLAFQEESLSFSSAWARQPEARSYFLLWAQDFDLASLNSNLSRRLFAGELTAEISLESGGGTLPGVLSHLNGTASFSSKGLLISKLGLDLINGGPNKELNLNLSELLTAMEAQDSGITDLKLSAYFKDGRARLSGSFDLPVSHVFINQVLDLKDRSLNGTSTLTSHLNDSITKVTVTGTLDEPLFKISPQKRGELRPGLFFGQELLKDEQAKTSDHEASGKIAEQQKGPTAENLMLPRLEQLMPKISSEQEFSVRKGAAEVKPPLKLKEENLEGVDAETPPADEETGTDSTLGSETPAAADKTSMTVPSTAADTEGTAPFGEASLEDNAAHAAAPINKADEPSDLTVRETVQELSSATEKKTDMKPAEPESAEDPARKMHAAADEAAAKPSESKETITDPAAGSYGTAIEEIF